MGFGESTNWDEEIHCLIDLSGFIGSICAYYVMNLIISASTTFLSFEGSGELLFSPSITLETYFIHEQSVDFHGVPNELEASMMITEDSLENNIALTISGKVDEAHISNMTLFPSFSAWYVKNIYLAPLSLISIVFGSISLMKKKRDE